MSRPVTGWENERVNGMALTCDGVHKMKIEEVDALRKRQAEYVASLPADREAAISAAMELLHPGAESYPQGFENALHLAKALRPMVESMDLSVPGRDRDAVLWIADCIFDGLDDAMFALDRIGDILAKPGRLEREQAAEKWRAERG